MLPDCESYYELYIEGKPADHVKKLITELWAEICRLGKTQYSVKEPLPKIFPDLRTQIDFLFTYYDRAREALEEQGEKRQPTKSEKDYADFIESMEQVTKITFSHGNCFGGAEECIVTFGTFKRIRNGGRFGKRTEYDFPSSDAKLLVDALLDSYVGLWQESYFDERITGGEQWSLIIDFLDGTKRSYNGSNCYPFSFEAVSALFLNERGAE